MNRLWLTGLATCFGILFLTPTAAASEVQDVSLQKEVDRYLEESAPEGGGSSGTLEVIFKQGLKLKADGIEIKIGGRVMFDIFFISTDDVTSVDTTDGQFLRRLRFYMSGTVYKNTIFKIQLDFAKGNETEVKDAYVGLKNLGFIDTLIVGHMYEPMGLNELTSSKYITFIERAMNFAPVRNSGIRADGSAFDKRMTWGVGIYRTSPDDDGASRSDGDYSFTLRITGLLVHDKEEQTLVHVGFGLSFRGDDSVRYRFRFGPGTGDRSIDTGTIAGVDDIVILNFEIGAVYRSLHAQAEVYLVDVNTVSGGDPSFTAFYFQIGYFLTGESRPYKRNTWSRVVPKANFHDGGGGRGAWELAFRFDTADLDDAGIFGGEQTILTFAVNWHWNPNTRVMFNVIFVTVEEQGSSDVDITVFLTRFQWDF